MRIATLDLTPELFIDFCRASVVGSGIPRKFIVKENPLPDDARVEGVRQVNDHTVRLLISSASFAEVADGQTLPELPPVIYETVYEVSQHYDYCKGGCGISFNEFPEMRHTEDECSGPECTCYEVIGGHQMGCYFYGRAAN